MVEYIPLKFPAEADWARQGSTEPKERPSKDNKEADPEDALTQLFVRGKEVGITCG